MRIRVLLPAAAAVLAGLPASTAAADPPVVGPLPCVVGVLSCYAAPLPPAPAPAPPPPPAPAPAPPAKPAPAPPRAVPCPGRDLLPTAATADAAETATLCLVNRQRRLRGLPALKPVRSLTSVAGAYAKRMAREDFFGHVSPGGSTFMARIKRVGYLSGGVRSWSAGENIAWGTGRLATPEAIVTAWMKSAGHRRNILTRGFTEMGLGISAGAPQRGVSDGRAATYVNEFGHRRR